MRLAATNLKNQIKHLLQKAGGTASFLFVVAIYCVSFALCCMVTDWSMGWWLILVLPLQTLFVSVFVAIAALPLIPVFAVVYGFISTVGLRWWRWCLLRGRGLK